MLTPEALRAFKQDSRENRAIANVLRREVSSWADSPVLDVGAGAGDLAGLAFPDHRVLLLDILHFDEDQRFPLHRRVRGDFLVYKPESADQPNTLLFCHSLQFLDDGGAELLVAKTEELGARKIVTVMNVNDGVMGEVLQWANRTLAACNPEQTVEGFPPLAYKTIGDRKSVV